MKVVIRIIIFIMSVSARSVCAGEASPLPLDEFLGNAYKNSRFKEILIAELSVAYKESLAFPEASLDLTSTGNYTFTLADGTSHLLQGSINFSKYFSGTGTSVSGGFSVSAGPSAPLSSGIEVGVEQDIVRNAFGRADRMLAVIAGNEARVTRLQIAEAYEEYLAFLITLYLDWYSAYQNVVSVRKALANSRALLDTTREKLKFGIARPVDVSKSELQASSKEEQLTALLSAYRILGSKIETALGKIDPGGDTYRPEYTPSESADTGDIARSIDDFMAVSRTAIVLSLISANAGIEVDVAADTLLPFARLRAGYEMEGNGYFPSENPVQGFTAGIELSIPLDRPHSAARYEISKIQKKQTELGGENTISSIKSSIIQLHTRIESEKTLLATTQRAVALANSIAEEELKSYNQGRTSLNDLISAYNTLDTQNLSLTNRLVLLEKLRIEWKRLTDTLVTELPDLRTTEH